MTDVIIVALITAVASVVCNIITNLSTAKKQEKASAVDRAVMNTKLDELTREVREHNNFALRMPVVEREIQDLQRRVSYLEKFHQAKN